jgi:hypothetical protein
MSCTTYLYSERNNLQTTKHFICHIYPSFLTNYSKILDISTEPTLLRYGLAVREVFTAWQRRVNDFRFSQTTRYI